MNRRHLLQSLPLWAAAASTTAAAVTQSPTSATVPRVARLRPALVAYSFRNELQRGTMTYEDLVRFCAEHELDGLDATVYWLKATSNDVLLPIKRTAYQMGVDLYSISVRSEMTRATSAERAKELEGVRGWIDVASTLGARHIRVFGGNIPKGATEEQAAAWVIEVLKPASEYAEHRGIILGLENHGGITDKAETIIHIVKSVNSPWVGINLDTGNFKTDALRQIQMCLPHAVNVQVKAAIIGPDGKRQPSDWDQIVKMVAASGYRGYLALEYEEREPAPTAVPGLLGRLKELCRKYSASPV
jgi:L-ribulose-5-phosphate 3-epimerase